MENNPSDDFQAALNEANGQISGMSVRAQQLAISISQQAKEIASLKERLEKAEADLLKATQSMPKHGS